MKCLICQIDIATMSLNSIKQNYPCFCSSCYWDKDYTYTYMIEVLQNHLKGVESMSELKFPTDEDYPEGFTWFAYDEDGLACWYKTKPYKGENAFKTINPDDWEHAMNFLAYKNIPKWSLTLREKHHPNDQGIKHDKSKINYLQVFNKDFFPTIEECSVILEQGSQKYSQDNWKQLDKSRIEKALLRHLMAYLSGEILDTESSQKHLSHVITNCLFLNWFENQKG